MPTLRASENVKKKVNAICENIGWTQERVLDWLLKDVNPDEMDLVVEGPTVIISRISVKKRVDG